MLPATPTVPEQSTTPPSTAALAASTVVRRGIAARVVRIMPVLYSSLITSTARTATTACPAQIPVTLSLATSGWQLTDSEQPAAASTAALTVIVSAAAASSSQQLPGAVRSLVHSACTASASVTRLSCVAGESQVPGRPPRTARIPPAPPRVAADSSLSLHSKQPAGSAECCYECQTQPRG